MTVASSEPAPPRKLGVVFEPDSIPLLALVSAVAGRWPLVWIVRESLADADLRPLRRFGEVVETVDVAPNAAAAQLRELGVSGITTFADAGLRYTAALGTELGLETNSPATAIRLTDKVEQRAALAAAGLPTPAFCRVPADLSETALAAAIETLPFPVVIKPAIGSGGRNTTSVATPSELVAELDSRWSAGDRQTLIVEGCIGSYPPQPIDGFGDYASVEVAVVDGSPQVMALTGRMPLVAPFRETGQFAPSHLADDEADAVCDLATRAVEALGVSVGCCHVEVKRTADGPRIIEVNGRVPGGGIPELLRAATGVDLYAVAVSAAMGEPVRPIARASNTISYAFALQPPLSQPSRLVDDWREQMALIPGVRHVEVRAESGTAAPADGSYGYLLLVSGEVAEHGALLELQARLDGLIVPDEAAETL